MKASDRFAVAGVSCIYASRQLPVCDLSVSGIYIATDDPPMNGQLVEVSLLLPGRSPFAILVQATWINPGDEPHARLPRGFGARITRIGFEDRVALLDAIRRAQTGR